MAGGMASPNEGTQDIHRLVLAQAMQIKARVDGHSAARNAASGFPVKVHQRRVLEGRFALRGGWVLGAGMDGLVMLKRAVGRVLAIGAGGVHARLQPSMRVF